MIKIGNLEIDKFYLGDKSDAKIYLGDVKVWPQEEEPSETYPYAFQRVSRGGSAYTVACNSTSSNTITSTQSNSGLSKYITSSSTRTETPVSVVFGDCCKTIGDEACSDWEYLSSVTISDSVTTLGGSAFNRASSISHLEIGSGITSITNYQFHAISNKALTKPDLDLSANVGLTIGSSAFASSYFNNVILPKNCTIRGSKSFEWSSASILSFGSGTQILDGDDINNAFGYCNISNIDLNGVTQIGKYAFYRAKGFTSITIPSSVSSIEYAAFQDCSGLTSITVDSATPPTISSKVFDNTNNCPIYVPPESVDAYKAASRWSSYKSRIQAIPT